MKKISHDHNLKATFVSLFPESVLGFLGTSILGKALQNHKFSFDSVNFRDFAKDAYKGVDDTPCGGGPGQVVRIDIAVPALREALKGKSRQNTRVILMDPAGPVFKSEDARRLSKYENLVFMCGRYEGIDSRIYNYVDESLSLGDFVITSGELAATVVLDAVLRFVPEVLGNEASAKYESHNGDLLEHSQYTRPIVYEDHEVPGWLLSGHHKKIEEGRRGEQLVRTSIVRPDLFSKIAVDKKDLKLMDEAVKMAPFPWQPKSSPA